MTTELGPDTVVVGSCPTCGGPAQAISRMTDAQIRAAANASPSYEGLDIIERSAREQGRSGNALLQENEAAFVELARKVNDLLEDFDCRWLPPLPERVDGR